jgi:hypothetical protein
VYAFVLSVSNTKYHIIFSVLFMLKDIVAHFRGEISVGVGVTSGIGCFYINTKKIM